MSKWSVKVDYYGIGGVCEDVLRVFVGSWCNWKWSDLVVVNLLIFVCWVSLDIIIYD